MSYLLAAGDSWTDANFKSDLLPKYDCSFPKWPKLLGDKLKMSEVVNVGRCGASNDWIFNRCYDEIAKRKPKLVFVLLSGWSRHSIFNYNFNIYDLLGTDYAAASGMLSADQDYWKYWIECEHDAVEMAKYLWSHDLQVTDIINHTLREIWLFQTFCKQHNIGYIIMSALEPIPISDPWLQPFFKHDRSAADPELADITSYMKQTLKSPYTSRLNEKTILGWPFFEQIGGWSVWSNFVEKENFPFFIDPELDCHPNALGHKNIAEMFYKGYQDVYGKIS